MKTFKFKNYEPGLVTAYFKNDKNLYCLMPGLFGIELLRCTKDGEPDYQIKTQDDFSFEGFDAVRWMFSDVRAYFEGVTDLKQQSNQMDIMFRS